MSTSTLFITACAPNVLTVAFAKNILKVDVSWMQWMVAFVVPGLFVLAAALYIIFKLCSPELTKITNAEELSRKGLEKRGPMTIKEKLLIHFFVLAVIGWATGNMTQINSTVVALLFFILCAVFKLITWDNVLGNKEAWSTLIWYG